MKVAINTLPGGMFDLSDKAAIELFKLNNERKRVYVYIRANNKQFINISEENLKYDQFNNITNLGGDVRDIWLSEIYLGMITINSRLDLASAEATQLTSFVDSIDRDNKYLIKILEEWGTDKVSGNHSYIRIEETTNENWVIQENVDGIENIIYY